MDSGMRGGPGDAPGADTAIADACRTLLERAPTAFAVTRGHAHALVAANETFRGLIAGWQDTHDCPIAEVVDVPGLRSLLDRAYGEGVTLRDQPVGGSHGEPVPWSCTVWPLLADGRGADGLVIELRAAAPADPALALQRELAERMLLGALREQAAVDAAEAAHRRATVLADAGRTLAQSIDEQATRRAVRAMHLAHDAPWCIVDVIEHDNAMRRLAIIHPDPAKQAAARQLEVDWSPEPGDAWGAPAVMRAAVPVAITDDVDGAVALTSHDAVHQEALRALGIGSLLTVPMLNHGRLLGAITFVGGVRDRPYTDDEVRLAEDLALQSAMALDSARMYREALELRAKADQASRAKSEFLGHMSHELRTPLNAIAGYVDLIDLGIRGPVTEAQHSDLERIRLSQQHLLVMINEILRFVHAESGKMSYDLCDLPVHEVLAGAVALVESLMNQKGLVQRGVRCDPGLVVRADRNRTQQILVNLFTNAVKFTPSGGEITVRCEATEHTVQMKVEDSGIGIPADQLEAVFEPFVQVRTGLTDRQGGVGLGLAISRDLARAMHGDLTAESMPGQGSRFTLSLPRARQT